MTTLVAEYTVGPRRIEIHRSTLLGDYTAQVTQGSHSIAQPGFSTMEAAMSWAMDVEPEAGWTKRKVRDS